MINRKAFFDRVRGSLFGGKLTEGQVQNLDIILDTCDNGQVTDKRQIAYILATAYHENYHPALNPDFSPVREGFCKTNSGSIKAVTSLFERKVISTNYALPEANGNSYYGRGYVQITWPLNYLRIGKLLGVPLYEHPDIALQPDVAARILVGGMVKGWFTGKKLSNYITAAGVDFVGARRIINGLDKAEHIAKLAAKFLYALN